MLVSFLFVFFSWPVSLLFVSLVWTAMHGCAASFFQIFSSLHPTTTVGGGCRWNEEVEFVDPRSAASEDVWNSKKKKKKKNRKKGSIYRNDYSIHAW